MLQLHFSKTDYNIQDNFQFGLPSFNLKQLYSNSLDLRCTDITERELTFQLFVLHLHKSISSISED